MDGLASRIGRALRDEGGGVTVLGLFLLVLTLLCAGFAIDASNFYRHQAMLRMAADAAAHAGASALARGDTPEAAEAVAMAMVALNLPDDPEGSLLADRETDLRALVLNPDNGRLSRPGQDSPANAMLVSLQRSKTARNPIPTLILGLFGLDSWSTGATSVAMVTPTRRCSNASGFFAHGAITIGQGGVGARPGGGLCVHSQEALSLPRGDDYLFGSDALLSLPARGNCTGGACGLAIEVNLVMPDTTAHVARLAEGFAAPGLALPEKRAFFADRPLAQDLEPLAEVGTDLDGLKTGSVVAISAFRFRLLREVPPGLVYLVLCGQPGTEIEDGGADQIVIGEWPDSPVLRNIALVTTCPIRLEANARIEGTLVITLAEDAGRITADPAARIGGPVGACNPKRRSVLMTTGSLSLPSHLTTSDLAVVAGGDVMLGLPGEVQNPTARGISVHAGGEIRTTGSQGFEPCPEAADPDAVLPTLRVISYRQPSVEGWVSLVTPQRDATFPGTHADPPIEHGM